MERGWRGENRGRAMKGGGWRREDGERGKTKGEGRRAAARLVKAAETLQLGSGGFAGGASSQKAGRGGCGQRSAAGREKVQSWVGGMWRVLTRTDPCPDTPFTCPHPSGGAAPPEPSGVRLPVRSSCKEALSEQSSSPPPAPNSPDGKVRPGSLFGFRTQALDLCDTSSHPSCFRLGGKVNPGPGQRGLLVHSQLSCRSTVWPQFPWL